MKCNHCSGPLEKVTKGGESLFHYCRGCKLPHDKSGNPLLKSGQPMNASYNPLRGAFEAVKSDGRDLSPVAKAAASVAFMPALQDAYLQGVKDGILLAFSQDVKEGEPV